MGYQKVNCAVPLVPLRDNTDALNVRALYRAVRTRVCVRPVRVRARRRAVFACVRARRRCAQRAVFACVRAWKNVCACVRVCMEVRVWSLGLYITLV